MISEKRTIVIEEKTNKAGVEKIICPTLRRGFFVTDITTKSISHTYETSGTPDTYTGHISDDGKTVTITKHPGTSGYTGSYTTINYIVSLEREFPDEQARVAVASVEKDKYKYNEKEYFLIHKYLYGFLPCKEEKLDDFSKVATLSGNIFAIIICWFLALIGPGGLVALIFLIATGSAANGAYIFLAIAYSLIGLAMTWFFGTLAVKEMICRYYKRKQEYKLYINHITPRYKESLEKCANAIVSNKGFIKTTGGDLAKSIALAIVLLPIPIFNLIYLINMIITIKDYIRWKKIMK